MEWRSMEPGVWHLDRVHYSHPVPGLYAALFPTGIRAGSVPAYRQYGLLTDGLAYQFVHGFGYAQATVVADPTELEHRCRQAELTFAQRRWRGDVDSWKRQALPGAIRRHLALVGVEPARLGEDIAPYLEECMTHFQAMVAQHHRFNPTVVVPVGDFVAHACEWTGCTVVEAFKALVGHSPVSRGVTGVALEAAMTVDRDPKARALLHGGQGPSDVLSQLVRLGDPVAGRVEQFLAHEGHRLVGGFDIGCPTALEAPQVLVGMLRRLAEPSVPTTDRTGDELRRNVPGKDLPRFDEMFDDAVLAFPLRDERGVYSDTWAGGILRRGVLALGRRLAASETIEEAGHLMEATPAELIGLARGATAPTGAELARRAAKRASAAAAEPPPVLGDGETPEVGADPSAWPEPLRRMWRAMRPAVGAPHNEGSGISGLGVGTACYEGEARVLTDLGELWRVRPGDVLVTPTTTEALNIVAPLLGALVTDFGGVISHAAITARECGIPAVVGCGDATGRIADGSRVRVDPLAGQVVVLPGT